MYDVNYLAYGYEITDDPDFPENSICILLSTGQSGHCSLVIVFTACDGGVLGVPNVLVDIPYGKCKIKEIPHEVEETLSLYQQSIGFLTLEDISQIVLMIEDDLG